MEKEITRKSIFLSAWKNKIGYSLNYKDIKELETMIIYYETQLKKQKEINSKAIEYIKEKQKIQYKFALSHIECDDLLEILEDKEV